MRLVYAAILIGICFSGCSFCGSSGPVTSATSTEPSAADFSEDEKHKLYTAVLAASDSPIDTDLFKEVCKKIGIFDAGGKPNDRYISFVAAHVEWALKPETEQFRSEINTKEKANEYVNRQLGR